jgi:enoyl-CoA hydratase
VERNVTFTTLLVERAGPVAVIVINRPEKRNALNAEVRQELLSALEHLTADDSVRVVVLTGAGEKAFVAGADIAEFAQRTPLEQRESMAGTRIFDEIARCPKPTIAMVNGFALGGGCELALACDIRIAAETARFGQPEVKLGLIPGGGGTQRLARLVGMGEAMRLVLSGDPIDAEEARRIGLVQMVVPLAELRLRTVDFATTLAARSPLALQLAKTAIRAAAETPLSAGLAVETELFLAAFASEDGAEGIAAFLEKRPPRFGEQR